MKLKIGLFVCLLACNFLFCQTKNIGYVGLYHGKSTQTAALFELTLSSNKTFKYESFKGSGWYSLGTYKIKKNKIYFYNYNLINLPIQVIESKDETIPIGFVKIIIDNQIYRSGLGDWYLQTNSAIFKETLNNLYLNKKGITFIKIFSDGSHRISKKIIVNPYNNYFIIKPMDSVAINWYIPLRTGDSLYKAKARARTLKGRNTLLKQSAIITNGKIRYGYFDTINFVKDSLRK